ncbi:MAG: hypothetical protein JSU96_06575, partial [Acidobacteriota bacterium]
FELAKKRRSLTIPDVIFEKFGCRVSSGLAAVGIVLGVVGFLGTQFQALGMLLSGLLDVPVPWAVALGAAVVVFYSAAGGMLASVYTDVIQGVLMLWTATLVFFFAVRKGGGVVELFGGLNEISAETLSPWGTIGAVGALSWFLVFAVGALGQPHVINKFMMVRDLRVLKYFPLVLAISMAICSLIWLGIGSVVKKLVLTGTLSPLGSPDEAAAAFLNTQVPPWLAAVAYVGIVAAIMSTADSFINIGAAALARDLPRSFGRPESGQVLRGRLWSLALVAGALLFSWLVSGLVAYLGIIAFSIFAASLTPALVLGLREKNPSGSAALASISTGLVLSITLELFNRLGWLPFQVSPALLSLAASFIVFVVCSRLCSNRQE